MSDPNSALSAWQLTIMAVVIVASLAAWLIAIYLADREPRRHDRAGVAGGRPPIEHGFLHHAGGIP